MPYPSLPRPQISRYTDWLREHRGLAFDSYEALWQWSVDDLEAFWQSIWDYFDIESTEPPGRALAVEAMPGAQWFSGARLNFAQQVLRHAGAAPGGPGADGGRGSGGGSGGSGVGRSGVQVEPHPAIVFCNEELLAQQAVQELGWQELRRQVAVMALHLRAQGVQPGDRVCAVMPHVPQTVVLFLATASLGAVWSLCSPDMGPVAILDRFRQIEPVVLVMAESYTWGGRRHDRRALRDELLQGLPSVRHLLGLTEVDQVLAPAGAGSGSSDEPVDFHPVMVPFDHPLWIVYSSGTTGLPKPIVHGHGGIMLEMLKGGALHNNLGPSSETGDRFHWFSSTGWIMWNAGIGALLGGTTICIYDGSPSGSSQNPDWGVLWRFAALAGVTFFGAGAAFYASCLKADVRPQAMADLSRLRYVGSTGSPLSDECYDWIWDRLPRIDGQPIWINPISGGTDFAGAFVAGNITLPVVRGQMQVRSLGAAVQAFSEDGQPLMDEVGELVCTRPLPSMPLRFWNDEGDRRLRESYFETFPGVWRHGDWIRLIPHRLGPEGQAVPCPPGESPDFVGSIIYGRSDATINRHGVRMGTSELYRAVEALPEVLDSLVVDLEYLGRESWMPLFVVLREGHVLDDALEQRIRQGIRLALSPRHVPNEILQVQAIPRTLSGKKMELPVKKLLMGAEPDTVMKRDAMANADSIDWYIAFARRRAA